MVDQLDFIQDVVTCCDFFFLQCTIFVMIYSALKSELDGTKPPSTQILQNLNFVSSGFHDAV